MVLTIDGDVVVRAGIINKKLAIDFQGQWKDWEELQSSTELQELISKASLALTRSKGGDKGIGG